MDEQSRTIMDEVFDAGQILRLKVLALDEAMTNLIGTTEYPDSLTSLHAELRDAALSYDRVVNKLGH